MAGLGRGPSFQEGNIITLSCGMLGDCFCFMSRGNVRVGRGCQDHIDSATCSLLFFLWNKAEAQDHLVHHWITVYGGPWFTSLGGAAGCGE